ncbi:hypothetical protein NC652_035210 [Populus alba x Populus x berolinensis]|nr:hypothetical protein NC652_035210 [Populus alba x Populus x berolinensis]
MVAKLGLGETLGRFCGRMHSMVDEHFGISVVEYMAAGAMPIDGQQTGFLAQNVEEYADAILKVSRMPETDRLKMAAAARKRAARFSEHGFFEDFKAAIRPMLNHVVPLMFLADNIAALYRICDRSSSSSPMNDEHPGSSCSLRVDYIFLVLHFCWQQIPQSFTTVLYQEDQLISKICCWYGCRNAHVA